MKVGFLFQQAALYDSLTVEENVAFPLSRHTRMSGEEQKERVRELLADVGMEWELTKSLAIPNIWAPKSASLACSHTWNQKLEHHPHVHCVVPAGGFSVDRTRWIKPRCAFFLPVGVLRRVFRGKFVAAWLRTLFRQDWHVYSRKPRTSIQIGAC